MVWRRCPACGEWFTGASQKRYCSERCAARIRKQRQRQRRCQHARTRPDVLGTADGRRRCVDCGVWLDPLPVEPEPIARDVTMRGRYREGDESTAT